jgi:hypothetical protein
MKSLSYCIVFIFSSVLLSSSLLAQSQLRPSKTETLATFTFLQPDNQPLASSKVLFKGNKGTKVTAMTNSSGMLKTLLPNNENFTTVTGENSNDKLIKTGNREYSAIGGQRYTHRFIEYSFYYKNNKGENVKGELVNVVSSSGKTYTQTTNANGLALFYLPIKGKYTVNLTHYPNAKKIDIPDEGYASMQLSHPFRGMSSVEKAAFNIEQGERAKEREKDALVRKKSQDERAEKAALVERQATKDAAQKAALESAIPTDEATLVVFFASQREHKGAGTITVYDGDKDGYVIGHIRSIWSCTRGPIKQEDYEAQTIKRKGTYSYYAKSSQGMEWEGTYEVLDNKQKNIPLRIQHK